MLKQQQDEINDLMSHSMYYTTQKQQSDKDLDLTQLRQMKILDDLQYHPNQVDYCQTERVGTNIQDPIPPRRLSPQLIVKEDEQPKQQQQQKKQLQKQFSHQLDLDSLKQFVDTIEVQFCITSPATRITFTNTKQVRNRQTLVSNTKKIWLENQSECVHSMFDTKTLRILIQSHSSKNTRSELLSAYHCNDLQGFVRIFCSLPEVRDSLFRHIHTDTESDKYGINAGYSELICALQDYIKESNEYSEVYHKMQIGDETERYLTRLIYERVFPKEPTARDIELNMRIKTLEWITYEHLEIKEKNRLTDTWKEAALILNEIDSYKNAVDKLEILRKCTQLITDTLQAVNNESSSADVVFPIVINVLIEAKPKRLQSNINFVELFVNKSKMMSEAGYCFTQFKSAILWLESVNHEQLKIDKKQFNRFVYEKEVKYNMVKQRQRKERVLINMSK